MSKKGIIFISLVLMAFTGFSQQYPRTIVLSTDTCIVFTMVQSKQMAIWNTQKNEYWDRINILNEELTLRDSVIYLQDIKVDKMALIQLSYKQIIVEKNDLKMLCEAEKKDYITEIKRQKRLSWMIGGLGALATGFSTYLFIKK
tara:strand:- start:573 stop:1004 length:432 start_codon:yes stop_codon:yes gene_type:complete